METNKALCNLYVDKMWMGEINWAQCLVRGVSMRPGVISEALSADLDGHSVISLLRAACPSAAPL